MTYADLYLKKFSILPKLSFISLMLLLGGAYANTEPNHEEQVQKMANDLKQHLDLMAKKYTVRGQVASESIRALLKSIAKSTE